jgi:hypothetical protein
MTQLLRMLRPGKICGKTVYVMALLSSTCAYAQLFTFSKQEIDYTANSPFRLVGGRPKVTDAMSERARELSSFFTMQFMPLRGDFDQVSKNKAKERGLPGLTNQTAIDMPAYFRSADPTLIGNVMLTGITCK